MSSDVAKRESAAPRQLGADEDFDVEVDIIVVGGGASGLPAALFSRWLDNQVLLLEKAPELGGTANKAAFWYWVPNNERMRELGLQDDESGFLRYCARLSVPHAYDRESPTLGMARWEYDACRAIYESASPAAELLAKRDALPYRHCEAVPDYWSELPEDAAPKGRVFVPRDARESMSDGGINGIRTMSAAARRDGVDIRLAANLQASVVRFNELARTGVDADFGRGERAVQQLFNGDVREEPGRTNPTMWPVSDVGPYYAALVTGGTLDTKGGPKTSVDAQVLDDLDQPIPGLYGIGNCVASASRRAYWAGGATIGPMIAFAYRAAQAADGEPIKQTATQGVHA